MRGILEAVKQRHITVTNYCPVLDRFIEKNPGYAPLIDSDNPGNWPKTGRNALGATRMQTQIASQPSTCQANQRKDAA